jgi:hypothetical protein
VVETQTQTISDSWNATISCKYIPNVVITQITDTNVRNTLVNTFKSLSVNFTTLGTDLGIGHALTVNDLDLTHIYQSYDINNPDTGKAITIAFKTNSNSNVNNYRFTMFTNGITYNKPVLIQTRQINF